MKFWDNFLGVHGVSNEPSKFYGEWKRNFELPVPVAAGSQSLTAAPVEIAPETAVQEVVLLVPKEERLEDGKKRRFREERRILPEKLAEAAAAHAAGVLGLEEYKL